MSESNDRILNKLFKESNTYIEEAVDLNKEEFIKVVESRRSVRIYDDSQVKEEDMLKCLELSLLSANSSNLQPWEFYWVKDVDKKQQLIDYCLGQPAAATAQELVVCVARPDNWKVNTQLMLDMFKEKELPKAVSTYYKKIVPLAYNQGFLGLFGLIKKISTFFIGLKRAIPREPTSFNDMKIWAHKSTALACQTLMLSLRAFGYDSCPMEGIDSKRIKQLLKLSNKSQICMVISAGKRADNGVYGKRFRLSKDRFIKII
ncbi:MAG: nitroreductase family protein [Flavobacteriales bacterium]|nr:nitroreductase family protein [Flavobacteriales bacterium]